jgi:type III restriction enzyme
LEAEVMDEVASNPQEFVTKTRNVLNRVKTQHVVDNVKYEHTEEKPYGKEILSEVQTYEDKTVEVENSVYDRIIYDSEGEREYAKRLDTDDEVIVFVKLPSEYTIPTPEGDYNPDWAIVHQEKDISGHLVEGKPQVYLVRETKFVDRGGLREYEKHKISCAQRHYDVLGVDFDEVRDVDDALVSGD